MPGRVPETARLLTWVAAFCAAAATAVDGATVHGSALALRVVVAVVCVAAWSGLSERRRLSVVDTAGPLLALAVVGMGIIVAPHPGQALQSGITVALVCALYVTTCIASGELWPGIARLAVVTSAAHGLWAVAQALETGGRGHGGFFNPNDLAALSAPALVIGVDLMLRRAPPPTPTGPAGDAAATFDHQRLGWGLASAAALAGLLATQSRSGLAAGCGGAACVALVRLRGHRLRPVLAIAVATVVAAGAAVVVWRSADPSDPYASSRARIWARSAEIALHHPAGVGLGHYPEVLRAAGVALEGPVRYPKAADHAHSEPLNAWVELGWLGLLATLVPPTTVALAIRRQDADGGEGRATDRASGPGSKDRATSWAIGLAFALPAAVSASLHVPPVAFLAAAWAGAEVRRAGRASTTTPRQLDFPRLGRKPLALLLAAVCAAAVPGAVGHLAKDAAARARDGGDLDGALELAGLAARVTPWSAGAGMLLESMRYQRHRDPVRAAEALVDLGERFPDDPTPIDRAAWLMENAARAATGDPDRARELWTMALTLRAEAVRRDPRNALAHYARAEASFEAGDDESGRDALLAALAEEPRCARCLARLAVVELERGARDRAAELAAEARAAAALAPHYLDQAGRILSLPESSERMLETSGLIAP